MPLDVGRKTAATAVAARLRQMFPKVDGLDLEVIAESLVEAIDTAAIDMVNAREEALQKALKATMDYMSGVIDTLRERVRVLEDEKKHLNRALARHTQLEAPVPPPELPAEVNG